mmetsp:Transcript_148944/g.371115  ORF Transcript_148944/g.371115 Transcript_148944/m.371115 type:complete len:296 (-) Transcript_148944:29-916(-)
MGQAMGNAMGNVSCCAPLGGGTEKRKAMSKVDEEVFRSQHSHGNAGRYGEESSIYEIRHESVRMEADIVQPVLEAKKLFIGFDFDCTLTVRHFYKVFAWGYAQHNNSAHDHCKAFAEWCREHDVESEMLRDAMGNDPMVAAVEDFCRQGGEAAFRDLFREVFLGGEERIALIASWLGRMQRSGVEFAIVTAGVSVSVLRALSAVPEWLPFFSSGRVWDTQQSRHCVTSVAGTKALMLRDLSPDAARILLVDDSLVRDTPPQWVLKASGVETFELPYEGPGVSAESLKAIEEAILR